MLVKYIHLGLGLSAVAEGISIRNNGYQDAFQDTSLAPDMGRWPAGIHLAVDYYPSQWPEWMWEPDVARMRESNISYVRVGEFDWSGLEPKEGEYNLTLLDKTFDLFEKYGLKAIVGTPTAAPPNRVTEKYDVSFVDRTNTTLLFGSRRHYSFSSFDYREQSQTYAASGVEYNGIKYNISAREEWIVCERDHKTSHISIVYTSRHRPGKPAACAKNGFHYLAFNPTAELLLAYIADVGAGVGLKDVLGQDVRGENDLGATLRLVRRGGLVWAFNYGWEAQRGLEVDGELIIGEEGDVPGAGVKVWKVR